MYFLVVVRCVAARNSSSTHCTFRSWERCSLPVSRWTWLKEMLPPCDSCGSVNTQDQVHLLKQNQMSSTISPNISSIGTVHASLVSSTDHKVLKNQDILAITSLWGHKGCSCLTCLSQVFLALYDEAQFFLKVHEPKTPISFHLFVFAGGCKQRVQTEICFWITVTWMNEWINSNNLKKDGMCEL